MTAPCVGLFVGGRGLRMGGVAKGRLQLPSGQSLLARLIEQCRSAVPDAELVLVGDARAYPEYPVPALADSPPGIGPLGGLCALLKHTRTQARQVALALACDLPQLNAELIRRLLEEQPDALALAAREDDRWQPFPARYHVSLVPVVESVISAGERSLQRIFARLGPLAQSLELHSEEKAQLSDWDRPEDVR